MNNLPKTVIIKLGGSLVSRKDEVFDFEYVKNLKSILEKYTKVGHKFCIVLGGGYAMRSYRDKAKEAGVTKIEDLHWIGTTVNVLHAELTRTVFGDLAEQFPFIYEDYYQGETIEFEKDFLIAGGARAGYSGDRGAMILANKTNSDLVISLKNIDYLYTADPAKDDSAQKVENATWDEYLDIIEHKKEHEPGGSYVVDPVATHVAKETKTRFAIMNGTDLENFDAFLSGKEFKGSIIGPE